MGHFDPRGTDKVNLKVLTYYCDDVFFSQEVFVELPAKLVPKSITLSGEYVKLQGHYKRERIHLFFF